MKVPWSIRYGGYILLGFGFLAIYAMLPSINLALVENNWSETQCAIEYAKMVSDEYGTDSLDLKYRYTVAGQTFQGTQYESKNNVNHSEQFFRALEIDLFPGREIACYYDPANPSTVVIHRMSFSDLIILLVPALFIALGCLAFFINSRPSDSST